MAALPRNVTTKPEGEEEGEDTAPQTGRGVCVVREVSTGEVCGYTTGISFDGHTIASSVPAAVALLSGMRRQQPQAHLRFMMPLRTAPALGAHCLATGWRVVKQLLMMSHGEPRMPTVEAQQAGGGSVFIPTADG